MLNNLDILFSPVKKLAELNKMQIEKAIATQQTAAKEYFALTESRIKAATEIKDAEGLNSFVNDQVELAKSSLEKIQADSTALIEDAKTYNEEITKLFQESSEIMSKSAEEVVKEATKLASK